MAGWGLASTSLYRLLDLGRNSSRCLFIILFTLVPAAFSGFDGDFPAADVHLLLFHQDYSPPSPPPPPPLPASVSCEDDLKGVGSLETTCKLNSNLYLSDDVYIQGKGNFYILPGVNVNCLVLGCSISVNVSGNFSLGENASIVTSTFSLSANNATFLNGSLVNTTGIAGAPPAQTSGTPRGIDGAGGGYGGRGACCLTDKQTLPDDVWGGDAYSWSALQNPWSYGSRGGTKSKEVDYGGGGGGRVKFVILRFLTVDGSILADGGDGGNKGGGGSGGSIFIKAYKMTGSGRIGACGGDGFAGGGGGRISVDVFSRHDEPAIFVNGGNSYGCPENAGAAGTFYDTVPRSLIVSNHNKSTDTDTLLLEFPYQPLWTNIFIRNRAKATVPLLWSRVQVQGQISLSSGSVLSFGLAHYASSEFELLAEELLMSDSVFKVYGALRMSVKMFLMWNSKMIIDGGGDETVATSLLEASNLVVLKESSVIHSNANLGVHGQGLLNLSGPGDLIEAQRLVLSLFYSIYVGPGSLLRGPLENAESDDVTPILYCELEHCPLELLHPPEDCNVNSSLSFTLQVCRVEDVSVEGLIKGSVVHFHRARNVNVVHTGTISASGMGCRGGIGKGRILNNGLGSGGGHGGKGGDGCFNGSCIEGGIQYGNIDLPCELGSGSGNYSFAGSTPGGGIVVMGSVEHPLSTLSIEGFVSADGKSSNEHIRAFKNSAVYGGSGGGSGGTILVFLRSLVLIESAVLSSAGGHGGPYGGGGGGGGRIHFHWSDIPTGDVYQPIADVKGGIYTRGGHGRESGGQGGNGTLTGKECPKGLYGVFCVECPAGTYKNVSGSSRDLCHHCPSHELPHRAIYIALRGGISETPCPYKCISDRYHLPNCYTSLEELIYTFGGPWLFGLILLCLLVLLALVLSVARVKFIGVDELPGPAPTHHGSQIDHSFPFLESLNEVLETNRVEESQSHVYRMYFLGPNTFSEPWHLPHTPPEQVKEIVYEGPFNTFTDEVNAVAAYQWWEGSLYGILSVLVYPLAWSWQQWRRKIKLQRLKEFVRSEYDHSCLRSCRSRALYEGLKVAATAELMLAYVDFFLGGDEKRADLPLRLRQRFPVTLVFGGDGSYMSPLCIHSDNILTSLMGQAVPPTTWYRLVSGLNAQLRLARRGRLGITLEPVVQWVETHANLGLRVHGIRIDLACLESASGYCQYGIVVHADDDEDRHHREVGEIVVFSRCKKGNGCMLDLQRLKERRDVVSYLLGFVLDNTRPAGKGDVVGLVISVLLLGDFSLVLLTILQLYSISLLYVLLVLLILPLGVLLPFPAGINALFSHGPRRSAALSRVYALWNLTSLVNVAVAFLCGFIHYRATDKRMPPNVQAWNFAMDESEWWIFPTGLLLCKFIQSRLINRHVANLEIQDRSLYSSDANVFWQS